MITRILMVLLGLVVFMWWLLTGPFPNGLTVLDNVAHLLFSR